MARNKDNPTPWDVLDQFRGKFFEGQWPTVKEMFEITASRYPDNKCFESFFPEHEVFTYSEALGHIRKIADLIVSLGAKEGDVVAVTGKNSPQWALCYLGILYAGCIVTPIDAGLHESEAAILLKFAGVKILFADPEKIEVFSKDATLGIEHMFSLEKIARNEDGRAKMAGESEGEGYVLDVAALAHSYPPVAKAKGSDVAAILFTSGTTGTPKGVQLTNDNIISDAFLTQGYMNAYSTDVFYAILPIHHSYTMLAVFIESITLGSNIVFGKKLIITQVLHELKLGKITLFMGVPLLFNKLIDAMLKGVRKKGVIVYGLVRALMWISGFIKKVTGLNPGKKMFGFILKKVSLENARICISGGGPLPAKTFRHFNEMGVDFVQGYGLTETSPIINLNPIYAYNEESVGKVLPWTEEKIVDPDENGNGLIYVRGPMVMKGYYHNQEATDEILDADGWLNTGDMGHLDDKGYLFLSGRARNIIVTEGGKNVFPEEIEDHFQLYFEIEQIMVASYLLDKENKSEGVRAIIYPSKAFSDSVKGDAEKIRKRMEEIVEKVNKDLIPYQRITRVQVVDEPLAMTSTKKIKRFVVAAKYAD